ncbi:aminoacyl-tRNA hydrolase [Microgenomates group bacterium]|nr:aminoacyl-tRNA hydrolase [Microgenomates group bacterium]
MKLIVGLGNPGQKYKNNRHNVGFMVVDRLMEEKLPGIKLLKPNSFMNRSGVAVNKYLKKWKGPTLPFSLPNLYVVHDDLDIELGKFKISFGKGPKVHNGLKSIYEQLGTKDFWHVRVGIDNRMKTGFRGTGEEYGLQNFRPEEREIIKKVIDKVALEVKKEA